MKMDLRWNLHHMTASIAKAFDLESSPECLWLFHGAPSASPEEPLNSYVTRNEQTTLKDVQRSAMCVSSQTKKNLVFHAVELPLSLSKAMLQTGTCSFCVRFFDDAVRETGNTVVVVPSTATAQD